MREFLSLKVYLNIFSAKLADIRSEIFAISGSDSPNIAALIGYANNRSHVFTRLEESISFFEAINDVRDKKISLMTNKIFRILECVLKKMICSQNGLLSRSIRQNFRGILKTKVFGKVVCQQKKLSFYYLAFQQ